MSTSRLKFHRAVFAGTARNCGPFIADVVANLARLADLYGASAYVFVVGDSNDRTESMLRQWIAHGHRDGVVVAQGELASVEKRRTVRIAAARNIYLDEVRRSYADFDHLIVCDLDQVLSSPINLHRFADAATSLDIHSDWVGVTANSWPLYFDIWALRHEVWCPHDCWHAIWERPQWQSFEYAKYRHVFSRQIRIPSESAPIEVESAFGGLAIYRMGPALRSEYVGIDASEREQAEHVAFNASITCDGGKLFLFPSLIVEAPREHLYDWSSAPWSLRLRMLGLGFAERWRPTWTELRG